MLLVPPRGAPIWFRMMKAVVIHRAGGPEVLRIEDRPKPTQRPGWVLIRVRAFGLNRSEMFTRQGHSPNVRFPRILGIEAVGEVAGAAAGGLAPGDKVATAMGGMGRAFDGGYGEYTLVPVSQVRKIETNLDWATLGALPEMIQTAHGSLHTSLRLQAGQTLLIRGGTTSVGLAAAILAKSVGATVIATTRNADRIEMLKGNGADHAVVDGGEIAGVIREQFANGVDRVLELVGTTTLLDSLKATGRGGVVCMTGMVGDQWELPRFSPMGAIPTAVSLTSYAGGPEDFMATPLQDFIDELENGRAKAPIGKIFPMGEIVAAHSAMEENTAGGKIVVTT